MNFFWRWLNWWSQKLKKNTRRVSKEKIQKDNEWWKVKARFVDVKEMILTREDVPITSEVNEIEIKRSFL